MRKGGEGVEGVAGKEGKVKEGNGRRKEGKEPDGIPFG